MSDGSFHRFVPVMPRHRVADGVCLTCDNPVHEHQGPIGLYRGLYQVKEMALALVEVARGTSYTETARRLRANYWGLRAPRGQGPNTVESGQVVADWLNQFGPVIIDAYAETEWPECVVLDSTEYQWTNPRTGWRQQLFVILCAWGYEAGEQRGRLWRVEARPHDRKEDWTEFLRALPGVPLSVVHDGDKAIGPAVRRRWSGKVPVHICEHHLWVNAGRARASDEAAGYTVPTDKQLDAAFQSPGGWRAFRSEARRGGGPTLTKWVKDNDAQVSAQTKRRASIPAHYSTGALDRAIAQLRKATQSRAWTFRNRERMNLLLGLMRLRVTRQDSPDAWAELIRQHLEARGGQPARPRRLADPITYNLAGERVYSLRA